MSGKSLFERLSSVNVNDHTEEKNGLTYLSWAWAWGVFKRECPDATYSVREWDNKPYMTDNEVGVMVMTEITAQGETHKMWLPVLDYKNKVIKQPDMFHINTAIMRCLTKNMAMFGLGHYIYAGEDLPESDKKSEKEQSEKIISNLKEEIDACETLEELSLLANSKQFKEEVDKLHGNNKKEIRDYYSNHNKSLKVSFEKDANATKFNDSVIGE